MKHKLSKPPIILVVGMHRSGTSLVAQMVAQYQPIMEIGANRELKTSSFSYRQVH